MCSYNDDDNRHFDILQRRKEKGLAKLFSPPLLLACKIHEMNLFLSPYSNTHVN